MLMGHKDTKIAHTFVDHLNSYTGRGGGEGAADVAEGSVDTAVAGKKFVLQFLQVQIIVLPPNGLRWPIISHNQKHIAITHLLRPPSYHMLSLSHQSTPCKMRGQWADTVHSNPPGFE